MLSTVPFFSVPLKEDRPPVPKRPALPTSSVPPPISMVLMRFTLPPVRPYFADPVRSEMAKVPPRFRMPLPTLNLPELLQLVGVMFSVPPLTLAMPLALLLNVVGLTLIVPAVTLSVPLLVKVMG